MSIDWGLVAFVVLVVIPVLYDSRKIPLMFSRIKEGLKGILFVPICLIVLLSMAWIGYVLSRTLTFLQWGWLGHNVVVEPLSNGAADGSLALTILIFLFIFVAILIFNWYEEEYYRDSWRAVIVWALLHLIMGIPVWALVPIFSVGIVYKIIYDRYGVTTSYVAHLFTNVALIGTLFVTTIFA